MYATYQCTHLKGKSMQKIKYLLVYTVLFSCSSHSMRALAKIFRLQPTNPIFSSHVRSIGTVKNESQCIISLINKRDLIGLHYLAQTHKAQFREKYDGGTPLHFAATCAPYEAIIRLLIDTGAPIDETNKEGDTALHLAVRSSNAETVKVLLEKGANKNIKNHAGKDPFHGSKLQIKDLLDK